MVLHLVQGFMGDAGSVAANGNMNKHVKTSFSIMRFIVTVGWSIHALGYIFGYLVDAVNDDILNLVCNLADVLNKIVLDHLHHNGGFYSALLDVSVFGISLEDF